MAHEVDVVDPLEGDPRVAAHLGDAAARVAAFGHLLRDEGVVRGVLGPREPGRLWERHLLNSAAVVPFLPRRGLVVDLGSGAGLPGLVVAAMLPDVEVVLLEPLLRRTTWLEFAIAELGLANARVERARAEQVAGRLSADAVTSRAVASLDKLYEWSAPLLRMGGELVALKGERASGEVASATQVARRLGFVDVRIDEARTLDGVDPTRVVRARLAGGRVR